MTSRSLQEHLASGDSMARLAAHAQRLLQFQRLLEAALPAALRPYARVANFRLGKLLIHAENGAVAAKIRQFGPSLANDLSNKEAKVTQIEVRVQARNRPSAPASQGRPTLPGLKQKQGLTALSRDLPEESPLKGPLERLLRSIKE
jgi:hypothetical protein